MLMKFTKLHLNKVKYKYSSKQIKSYNILTITNKYKSMSEVISHDINYKPTLFTETLPTLSVRNKSPQHEKQILIEKIELLVHTNDKLEVKQ